MLRFLAARNFRQRGSTRLIGELIRDLPRGFDQLEILITDSALRVHWALRPLSAFSGRARRSACQTFDLAPASTFFQRPEQAATMQGNKICLRFQIGTSNQRLACPSKNW